MIDTILKGFIRKNELKKGERADIQKIFGNIFWSYLNDTEKRQLGKDIYNNVISKNISCINFHNKNAAGHAYYIIN